MQETENSNLFDKNCAQEDVKCHIQHEESWLRWIVIEQVNYYFPLIFPERYIVIVKKYLWRILRKLRQNAWRTIYQRDFFVNLLVGISQIHYRLKAHVKYFFTVCGGWNSATSKWNKQTHFIKEVIWKFFQNSQRDTRCSHPEVFLSKDVLKNLQNSQINISTGVFFLLKLHAGNLILSEAAIGDFL